MNKRETYIYIRIESVRFVYVYVYDLYARFTVYFHSYVTKNIMFT